MASCSAPATAATPYFPPALIPKVARRLTSLQDFFALRASCRAYRAALPLTPSKCPTSPPRRRSSSSSPTGTGPPNRLSCSTPPLRRGLRFRLPGTRQDSSSHVVSLGCRVVIRDYLRDLNRRELRMVHLLTGEQTRLPSPVVGFNHFVLSGDLLVTWGLWRHHQVLPPRRR
ncbi:hypothetical protein SEVIR_9G563251v4 [Setaria viridis]